MNWKKKGERYKPIFPEFAGYQPEYSQSHLPVRQQKTAEGHAVRAVYLYSAMADLAYEYQDEELEKACETLWNNMVQKRMYITGGIGSSGLLERFTTDYDLPNDRNYSESCASIGLAMFGKRMGDMTRDDSLCGYCRKSALQYSSGGNCHGRKKLFLCESSGGMAGQLYGENLSGACKAGKTEMVWRGVLST